MGQYQYDIGVIGGGAAGLTVAAGAARLGARTLLLEKEASLGGDCLHYGCVPSKALLHVARIYHQTRHQERFGLPAYCPGPVDLGAVSSYVQQVIGAIQAHDSSERFCGMGVAVKQGEPEFESAHVVKSGTERLSAKYWVVATGSEAAVPPLPGLVDTPFWTNRDIFSLRRLPSSLVVLGAGPVAVEMAQAFCRLGSAVTIVHRGSQLLSHEDADMAALVQGALEAEGVRIVLGFQLDALQYDGKQILVSGGGPDRRRTICADRLLVALGRRANTRNLGFENLGIACGSWGVEVDRRLRTACPNIFAAGDVTGRFQYTHAAGYEGGVVLANTVFRLPRKADYTWMPWCTYTDPELASIGCNEKRAKEKGLEYDVWEEEFATNDRATTQGVTSGKLKMVVDKKERPLGVQICGPGAGELVGMWATIFSGKVKLSTLAGTVFPYPTLSEINKRVAGSIVGRTLFSERVRKGLSLIFQLKGRADERGCGLGRDSL